MAFITSIGEVVAQAPDSLVEFSTHIGALTIGRNVYRVRLLAIGDYFTSPTLRSILGAIFLGYLPVLFPGALSRMIRLARIRRSWLSDTVSSGVMRRGFRTRHEQKCSRNDACRDQNTLYCHSCSLATSY